MNANTGRSGSAVKPGDLAIVYRPGARNHGRLVEVLRIAPSHDFRLPGGNLSQGTGDLLGFVCKSIGGRFEGVFHEGVSQDPVLKRTLFMAIWSGFLRPLPGEDVPEVERSTEEVEA